MATRVDATFFTNEEMPQVSVINANLCKIVRIGEDISLYLSWDQLAYLASQLSEAAIDTAIEEAQHAAV